MIEGSGAELERLVKIMARLRAENGCPWDRAQDLRSLRPYLVEEAYEVLDEMDRVGTGGPWQPLCEELGDLLFQIVFHAQLASELSEFSMGDVCRAISDKIESRHPHVFGEKKVSGAEEVLVNWAKLKAEEKRRKTGSEGSVLDGVPTAAPALLRAERLTEKASRIGFDWPDLAGVRAKLREELDELDEAIALKDRDALEMELGDVLFSVANLARFIQTPAEDALRQAINRFTWRFHEIESGLAEAKVPFGTASLEQMEALWQKAKAKEHALPPVKALPRAPLLSLRFAVIDLAITSNFWNLAAPALGWARLPEREGEVSYSDGTARLCFFQAEGAGPSTGEISFEASSAAAVDAFARALPGWGAQEVTPLPERGADRRGPYSVSFTDPSGLHWRYLFGSVYPQAL